MMCAGPWPRPPHYNVDAEDRQPIDFATSQHCSGGRGGVMGCVGGSGHWLDVEAGRLQLTSFHRFQEISTPFLAPLWSTSVARDVQTRLRVDVRSDGSVT